MAHKARRGKTILIDFSLYFIVFLSLHVYTIISFSLSYFLVLLIKALQLVILASSVSPDKAIMVIILFYALNNYLCYSRDRLPFVFMAST